MAETKEEITADRDELRKQVMHLRERIADLQHQLAAAGTPAPVEHTFRLSEGARQELARDGHVLVAGQRLTRDEVAERLPDSQAGIELGS